MDSPRSSAARASARRAGSTCRRSAGRRGVRLAIAVVAERSELVLDAEDDVAAASTIAAVRPAARDVGLTAEGDHAFAAVAATDQDARAIEEHLDPRERAHEGAEPQMRQLLPQTLERARDTDRRLARLHQGQRPERVGREAPQPDRACP